MKNFIKGLNVYTFGVLWIIVTFGLYELMFTLISAASTIMNICALIVACVIIYMFVLLATYIKTDKVDTPTNNNQTDNKIKIN